jgi:hypothetical protein
MTAHRAAYDLFKAEASRQSSVDAEVIYVDASPLVVNLPGRPRSSSRTLGSPRPSFLSRTAPGFISGG